MTLTPRAKRVIDLAFDESKILGNDYIGTEHLLLGLIREEDGLAGRVLAKLGLQLGAVQREVARLQDAELRPRNVVTGQQGPDKPKRRYSWSDFGEEAKEIFLLADQMAQEAGDPQVAPYHLVAALLSLDKSVAAETLQKAGLKPERLRDSVEKSRLWVDGAPEIRFSLQSRQVIEAMLDETSALGRDEIGSDSLLLGLVCGNREGVGRLVADLGVLPSRLRQVMAEMESGDTPSD